MSSDEQEFWSTLPGKVQHPVRVPILEAFLWIGEPISAITLVDLLDGLLSMRLAARHLHVLVALGVVEPFSVETDRGASGEDRFDIPHRLTGQDSEESA